MLTIRERMPAGREFEDRLVLPFELRRRSRLRVRLQSGDEAALLLDRGGILQDHDRLRAEDGRIIQIVAASEPVLLVTAEDPLCLMRAAYHLGNRHVPLQIGEGWLRLGEDHVLEHMLIGLGVRIRHEMAAFEPESGAYGGGHTHSHDDDDHPHHGDG